VILCRRRADEAMTTMRKIMGLIKLTVNETKTHVCRLPTESFDFLGYTFGRMHSPRTGRPYIGVRPSRKKVVGVCRELNKLARELATWYPPETLVYRMNQVIRGWTNYFSYGTLTPAYRIVHQHARHRVRRWLRRKHQTAGRGISQFPDEYLDETLGLLNVVKLPRCHSWANT